MALPDLSGDPCFDGAHDALNRMRRACERGTGCYLTTEMIQSLRLTHVGETWAESDPRTAPAKDGEA